MCFESFKYVYMYIYVHGASFHTVTSKLALSLREGNTDVRFHFRLNFQIHIYILYTIHTISKFMVP